MHRLIKSVFLPSIAAMLLFAVIFLSQQSIRPAQAATDTEAPVVMTSYTRNFETSQRSAVMTSTLINFNVWAADNITPKSQLQYRHSEDPSFAGVSWGPHSTNPSVTLSIDQVDEETTLYIQVKDQAGNIKTISLEFYFVSGLGCGGPDTEQAVHRFWSDQKQTHFYTSSDSEKNQIIATYPVKVWKYEGVAYKVLVTGCNGNLPVYRFWSDEKQSHFYTRDPQEAVDVTAIYPDNVWKYERIAFRDVSEYYGNPSKMVYRFWSQEKQSHFYTISEWEKNHIIATYPQNVWKYEGTAFRAIE